MVRWITADDNYRGRAKYDQHASRTMWITYDMAPAESTTQVAVTSPNDDKNKNRIALGVVK